MLRAPRVPNLALALAALAALAAAGCRAPEGPAERYRRFAEAARGGRAGEVWAMLSQGSRRALSQEGKGLAGKAPSASVDLSGPELVLGDLAPTAPRVKSVSVVRESGDEAVVAVVDEGGVRGEVTMVREGGEWRVQLPGG